jgi:hypothetical protein
MCSSDCGTLLKRHLLPFLIGVESTSLAAVDVLGSSASLLRVRELDAICFRQRQEVVRDMGEGVRFAVKFDPRRHHPAPYELDWAYVGLTKHFKDSDADRMLQGVARRLDFRRSPCLCRHNAS